MTVVHSAPSGGIRPVRSYSRNAVAMEHLALPDCFRRFRWERFSGQSTRDVTYFYAVTPEVARLRGKSSVLYIGQTENGIDVRYRQETATRNTPGNSQATNIRTTHVISTLRVGGAEIELFFTAGLSMDLAGVDARSYGELLETWNKNHFLKEFEPRPDGSIDVQIEKFLLAHYAAQHLEVPPLNNRAG